MIRCGRSTTKDFETYVNDRKNNASGNTLQTDWDRVHSDYLALQQAGCVGSVGMFKGNWAFNGNGFRGDLLIEPSSPNEFVGIGVIDAGRIDDLQGSWDEAARQIMFTRTGIPGIAGQTYTGYLFGNRAGGQALTVAGTFTETDTTRIFGWFATWTGDPIP